MKWIKRIVKKYKYFKACYLSGRIIPIKGEPHNNKGIDIIWEDGYSIDPKLN